MKLYYEYKHDLAGIRNKLRIQHRDNVQIAREKLLNTKRKNLEDSQHFYKTFSLNEVKNLNLSALSIDTPLLETLKRTFILGEEFVAYFIKHETNTSTFQKILKSESMELQAGVAGCLVNMTLYSHITTNPVVQAFSPYLITMLEGSNPYLQEIACQAIANMLADCHLCNSHLQKQGAFPILAKLSSSLSSRPSVMCFSINAFARCFPLLDLRSRIEVVELLLPTISLLLKVDDPDINKELLKLLFHFSGLKRTCNEVAQDQQILFCLLQKLTFYSQSPSQYITHSTLILRCLANMIGHFPPVGIHVLTFPYPIPCLLALSKCQEFSHPRKEIFWLLTNILTGSQRDDSLKEVVAANLDLGPFFELLPSILHPLNSIHTINQALYFLQAAAFNYKEKIPWEFLKRPLLTLASPSSSGINSHIVQELLLASNCWPLP